MKGKVTFRPGTPDWWIEAYMKRRFPERVKSKENEPTEGVEKPSPKSYKPKTKGGKGGK